MDAEAACESIFTFTTALQYQYPEAFIVISVDFYRATLVSTLVAFHQYVDCSTRKKNRTIDLIYANPAIPLLLLGKSDHKLVHLQPRYIPLVRRQHYGSTVDPLEQRILGFR